MALINCTECGAQVSERASSCPKCGCPISEDLVQCPECSKMMSRKAEFCTECGCPLTTAPKPRPVSKPEPKREIRSEQLSVRDERPPERKNTEVADGIQRAGEMAKGFGAAMAMHKSYVGLSFLVFFLYFVFYLPGLILNFVYLSEAGRIREMTGIQPHGTGCLITLIWLFFWLPLIAGVIFLIYILTQV